MFWRNNTATIKWKINNKRHRKIEVGSIYWGMPKPCWKTKIHNFTSGPIMKTYLHYPRLQFVLSTRKAGWEYGRFHWQHGRKVEKSTVTVFEQDPFLLHRFSSFSMVLSLSIWSLLASLHHHMQIKILFIYIFLEPNDPCFDWKRPCFGGLTFKNRGHLGSRYI